MPSEVAIKNSKIIMQVAKLSEHAHLPTKGNYFFFQKPKKFLYQLLDQFQISGSKLAAGYDLKSAYDYIIPGMGKIIAKTDISIRVPDGTYGRVAPRSGLAAKNHIDIGAGVVDQDYTGNIGVVMFNHAQEDFEVKKGDRIAQFICEKIEYPELEEVASLSSTERGEGGFGSTGTMYTDLSKGPIIYFINSKIVRT